MSAYTSAYGVRCTALRLTNVYGPGMQAKDSIVARLMRAIRLRGSFEIYGDGRQVRDYVHVSGRGRRDPARADRRAVAGADGDRHRPARSRCSRSWTRSGGSRESDFDVRHGPAKPGEMPAVIVDPSRARAAGWSPRYTFSEGLVGVWDEWSRASVEDMTGPLSVPGMG